MTTSKRPLLVLILLACTALIAFTIPKAKYSSPDILSRLRIPAAFENWESKDVSGQINTNDLRYNFISEVFARIYANHSTDQALLFLVLDAGNFHNPKVCFSGSGYAARDLDPVTFKIKNRVLKTNAVFFSKPGESFLTLYWITVDKQRVDWAGQKWLQLWHSLFNRRQISLMMRIDIPCGSSGTIPDPVAYAQPFLDGLTSGLSPDDADYLFGRLAGDPMTL